MESLLQICIVILTVGTVVLMVLTVRLMNHFAKAADHMLEISRTVRESADRLELLADEAQLLMTSLADCVRPVRRAANRFEVVAQRFTDLSSTLIEELEAPVFTIAALARGLRAGSKQFLQRFIHRISPPASLIPGGPDHE